MGNTTQIIKDTFRALKRKNLTATPKNYSNEFQIQAKTHNLEQQYHFSDIDPEKLKVFISELNKLLTPSINNQINEEIESFISDTLKNPENLFEIDSINALSKITSKRIAGDKKVVNDKTSDIIKLTKLLSKQFQKMILTSDNSSGTFLDIKDELTELHISKTSTREIGALQMKLIDTIDSLEEAVKGHRYSLLQEKGNLEDIEEKCLLLEQQLKKARSEKNIDYLTNIYNRRAFDMELEKIEKRYDVFGSNYAIALYDIDHFKKVNDKYGHQCGDSVLKTFAALLGKLSRDIDVLARYGGEEFVVILNYSDTNEIVQYVQRIKQLIKQKEFKYKEHTIQVKFSGGIALRSKNKSSSDTINKADTLLYQAKNQGRDKVILENGTVI